MDFPINLKYAHCGHNKLTSLDNVRMGMKLFHYYSLYRIKNLSPNFEEKIDDYDCTVFYDYKLKTI